MMPVYNEYRELAQADAVRLILSSQSLYPADAQGDFYLYGPLFPLLAALFTWLTGTTPLTGGRILSLLLTLLTAALAAFITYRAARRVHSASQATIMALVTSAWMLRTWSYGNFGVASPSTLGCLMMLAALVTLPDRLSWPRLTLSALLAVACFFTKPYFFAIAGVGIVILALRNRKLCAWYAVMVTGISAIATIAVVTLCPPFFVYNVLHHLHMGLGFHPGYLLHQIINLAKELWPLLLCSLYVVCAKAHRLSHDRYFVATISLGAVWLIIGQHPGQYMTYAFNLWYIPAVIFTCLIVARRPLNNLTCVIIVLLGLGCWNPGTDDYEFMPSRGARQQLKGESLHLREITEGKPVLSLSPVAGVLDTTIITVNNGMKCYTPSLASSPSDASILRILLPKMDAINATASSYQHTIDSLVNSGEYEWIIADRNSPVPSSLLENYAPIATFSVNIHQSYPSVTLYHRLCHTDRQQTSP